MGDFFVSVEIPQSLTKEKEMSLFRYAKNLVRHHKSRVVIIISGLALLGSLLVAGTSGAYFSETQPGNITGTIGSIHAAVIGGVGQNNSDFAFNNLLPGVPQTITIGYKNTGNNPQDVYIVFPNATALSSLNNLGTYGNVTLSANGTVLFQSSNLNDRSATCGSFSTSGCWPLLRSYKVASNLAPGATGTVSFTFAYASKLSTQPPVGTTAYWNVYPASPCAYNATTCPNGQTTVNASDGTGNGLPYEIVATQVGISLAA